MTTRTQHTPTAGFRDVTLIDRRGRVLGYAGTLAVRAGAIGLTHATFAPGSLTRLSTGRAQVTALAHGRPVLVLTGVRIRIHTGDALPEGGWICDAAVGTFESFTQP